MTFFSPVPEIRWQKKGQPLPWGRYSTINYGKTLVLNNVDFDDEGSYECTAMNGVGSPKSYAIKVTVECKHYIQQKRSCFLMDVCSLVSNYQQNYNSYSFCQLLSKNYMKRVNLNLQNYP